VAKIKGLPKLGDLTLLELGRSANCRADDADKNEKNRLSQNMKEIFFRSLQNIKLIESFNPNLRRRS
jgi:hypothetical protein